MMAKTNFKIKLNGSGQWMINVIRQKDDNDWEIVSPNPKASIDLPKDSSFFVYVNVAAVAGTTFELFQGDSSILSGETDKKNAFANYIIITT